MEFQAIFARQCILKPDLTMKGRITVALCGGGRAWNGAFIVADFLNARGCQPLFSGVTLNHLELRGTAHTQLFRLLAHKTPTFNHALGASWEILPFLTLAAAYRQQ